MVVLYPLPPVQAGALGVEEEVGAGAVARIPAVGVEAEVGVVTTVVGRVGLPRREAGG